MVLFKWQLFQIDGFDSFRLGITVQMNNVDMLFVGVRSRIKIVSANLKQYFGRSSDVTQLESSDESESQFAERSRNTDNLKERICSCLVHGLSVIYFANATT